MLKKLSYMIISLTDYTIISDWPYNNKLLSFKF